MVARFYSFIKVNVSSVDMSLMHVNSLYNYLISNLWKIGSFDRSRYNSGRLNQVQQHVGQVVSTLVDDPGSILGGGAEQISSASDGTLSPRYSRSRALVARVSCNWYNDLK